MRIKKTVFDGNKKKMSRQLKRQLSKFEENEKKKWTDAIADYNEKMSEPARNPTESYKKRKVHRPPVIVPKSIPRFEYNKWVNLDPELMHFLDTAIIILINAENIQSWFFDKQIVPYFHTDLECGDRAIKIVRRMIEIAQNPETPREEEIDSYIEHINRLTMSIEASSKIPDIYKFALHILAQTGPIPDRLSLLSAGPAELADFISAVIQKPVEGEFDAKWEIESEDEDFPIGTDDNEQSETDHKIGGGGVIIDLVDEDEDYHRPPVWRKRHYDEVIDLVSSSSSDEE